MRNPAFIFLLSIVMLSCSPAEHSEDQSFDWPTAVEPEETGAVDRTGDQVFASPGHVLPLESGGFIVGDSQTLTLHLFGSDLAHQHSTGGSGEGPGEFQRFSDLTISQSVVKVYDNRRSIVSEMEVKDEVLSPVATHDLSFAAHPDHPAAMFWRYIEGDSGDHMALYYDFNISAQEPLAWHKIVAFPYDEEYTPATEDPVGVFDYTPELRYENGVLGVPYLKRGLIASANGNLLYARSDEPAVRVYDLEGNLVQTVRLPDTSIELARSQKTAAYDRRYANSPDPERFRSEVLPHIPDRRPVIRSLRTDADGRIWVRLYREEGEPDWLVLDNNGTPLMQLALPDGHAFRNASGNQIYTQRSTDDGPEIVILEWVDDP